MITIRQLSKRLGVPVAIIRKDISLELLYPIEDDTFTELEAANYIKYRRSLVEHKPGHRTDLDRSYVDRVLALVDEVGLEEASIELGIQVESIKRNIQNWKKRGRI